MLARPLANVKRLIQSANAKVNNFLPCHGLTII